MSAVAEQHNAEVRSGQRFAFGKNWANFLSRLNEERIALAVKSLASFLQVESLEEKSFLDIGSGSGLFSLAARRLGARVFSFDYDTDSVGCTQELRHRYYREDPQWQIEQGSVLNRDYLARLGTFDIVYSWGVLHHTGAMWDALENVKPLVPVGGQLFIAIYNDQGASTDRWFEIKRRYNSLPKPLALLFALSIIAREERQSLRDHWRNGTTTDWARTWRDYDKISTRGMSRWHDWIDWIGGYPYERATIEQIVDHYGGDGFRLTKLCDRSSGYGCNEFVFRREGPAGTFVFSKLEGGNSFSRQFGAPVLAPYTVTPSGATGRVERLRELGADERLVLISGDKLACTVTPNDGGTFSLPSEIATELLASRLPAFVVPVEIAEMRGPFRQVRGHMWEYHIPALAELADHTGGGDRKSPAFVFENDRQLPIPHAMHDDIDRDGAGRFSHWGASIYFSPSDNSDPNTNGRTYRLLLHRGPQVGAPQCAG